MAGDVVKVDDAGYLDLIADRGSGRKLCQCICLFGHQVCDGRAHHLSVEAFLAVEIAVDQALDAPTLSAIEEIVTSL